MSSRSRSVLVLGGARSGKSRFASQLAERSRLSMFLIATAQACDAEMAERISRHQADRGAKWTVLEEPIEIPARLVEQARSDRVLVVDCLTLWLTNILLAGRDEATATRELASAITDASGPVILVSNEVGYGIVPANELARRFRDVQGRLNQAMAECCDTVVLVAAGRPLLLKPAAPPTIVF